MRQTCEEIVAQFLRSHEYHDTLAAFEAERVYTQSDATAFPTVSRDLRTLIEHAASKAMAEQLANVSLTHDTQDDDILPTPASPTSYTLQHTYEHLHTGNILSIAPATYPGMEGPCVATTGADKRIVFTNATTGEVAGMLYKDAYGGHDAAVLDVSQASAYPSYAVTAGMDGKVIVWDLTCDRAVQTLKDHTKFVVRIAHSDDGRFMASAGYDKAIHIYEVVAHDGVPTYRHVHKMPVTTNPESILFVLGPVSPDGQPWSTERTWLVYTCRDNVELHYVALPMSSPAPEAAPDWTMARYNTNPDPDDYHAGYSLVCILYTYPQLHLTLHPSGKYVAAQTGDHGGTDRIDSTANHSLSRLLLLPLFSQQRRTTLWTEAPSSAFANPRHAWTKAGDAVWVTGEDGLLRLVGLSGEILARVRCHGMAATSHSSASVNAALAAAAWRQSGNTVIKGVAVLPDGRIASCGFDKTVRVLHAC